MYTFTNVTSRQLRHSVQVLDAALERHRDAENVTGRLIFTTNFSLGVKFNYILAGHSL